MRNCVIWCVVILAAVGTAYSQAPKPPGLGKARQEDGAGGKTEWPPKELTVDLGGGVKMEFVLIPAGSFMMGDKKGRYSEKPVHKVTTTKPFYLGKYEVTQKQWQAVMGSNPRRYNWPEGALNELSWDDCQAFIAKMNSKSRSGDAKFGLPTEAQWEYACRAGTTTRYSFGDDPANLDDYAIYGGGMPEAVGKKKPNAWGLYDMHGNVREWCADCWDEKYYAKSPANDPVGPNSGEYRVMRGGAWDSDRRDELRCAYRSEGRPDRRYVGSGFRVARTLTP